MPFSLSLFGRDTAFREQGLQPLGHLSASANKSPADDVHLNDYGRIVKTTFKVEGCPEPFGLKRSNYG